MNSAANELSASNRGLEILTNNEILKNLLLDLAYARHNMAHI